MIAIVSMTIRRDVVLVDRTISLAAYSAELRRVTDKSLLVHAVGPTLRMPPPSDRNDRSPHRIATTTQAPLVHVVVTTTPQRLVRGEAMARQVTTDATIHQVTEAIVATPALPYALTAATAAGREAHLAPHLAAVVVTTPLATLDHPLAALDRLPLHHGAAARLVAPHLLVAVLEDADSRHF